MTAPLRITAIAIDSFMRLRSVRLRPEVGRAIVRITGRNAQGKTSIMTALAVALGGAKWLPADPVNHDAESAEIKIELDGDGGALVVRRRIAKDGTMQLEVRDADGVPVRKPQERLDALVGHSMLDPLAFLQLKAPEQRAKLLALIPEAEQLATFEAQREAAFKARTDVNRALRDADGELARLPCPEPVEAPDVGDLHAQLAAIAEQRAARRIAGERQQAAAAKLAAASEAQARTRRALEAAEQAHREAGRVRQEAEAELQALELDLRNGRNGRDQADELAAEAATETRVKAAIADAKAAAARAAAATAAIARYTAATAQRDNLAARSERLTAAIAGIDASKAALLEAAQMPVEGLSVTAEAVTYQGVPLAQASGAERLRVALALAIAARPGLRDVWIRDGALLDDDSLAAVEAHAAAAGACVWVELVGEGADDAIIISDGTVVDQVEPAPAPDPAKRAARRSRTPKPD